MSALRIASSCTRRAAVAALVAACGAATLYAESAPRDDAVSAEPMTERTASTSVNSEPDETISWAASPVSKDANIAVPASQPALEFAPGIDGPSLVLKLAMGVGGVLVLFLSTVVLGAKLLRKSGPSKLAREMELLDTLFVAPRCCLHLVNVQDQLVLVGRDATGLKEIVPIRSAFDARLMEASEHGFDLEQLGDSDGALPWPQSKHPNS